MIGANTFIIKFHINIVSLKERMIFMSTKYCNCPCGCQEQYKCNKRKPIVTPPPTLATDCVVVESLICSERVNNIAELTVPIPTLGDIISIGPGGVITPPISLTPNIDSIVSKTTVVKDMVIMTGYLPASVTILGIETPLELNIPFQSETVCPGVCPEDTVQQTPFQIETSVTQGIESLGVSVGNILFKVVMSTNLTVTRPIIAKSDEIKVVNDVNENRCQQGCCHG